ncbi:DnaJ domain-containing protein [Nitrospina watsonii]|uniref:DnaJ-class molecular chaperone CbpA n=1 Tax=Nitrospina watsonii TaxID=1323948 RepID=A0ABM9HDE1_9BACT|nr:DnaJ domain-containing protein [Nitrospina watsonii]CAI2718239.1 DnaJ-class molecular chaperone CbpA [Nitrospina watsonii]
MNATRYVDLPECFQVLNVAEGVSWQEIKKAYYQLAKQYHPDKNPNDTESEDRFKKIAIAFGILERYYRTHPRLRLSRMASPGIEEPVSGRQRQWSGPRQSRSRQYVADEERARGNGNGFHKTRARATEETQIPQQPARPSSIDGQGKPWWSSAYHYLQQLERRFLHLDIEKVVNVEAHTALNGGTVRMRAPGGTFNVRIPAGTQEDLVLRIPEKGERGLLNRNRGDLVLRIQVSPSRVQQGEDFYYQVCVPARDLSLGQVMVLETHEGPIRYALPKDTVTGQTFVLKAQPESGKATLANHIIVVEVVQE